MNFNGSRTVCPSGLRGWTQVPLAQAAWVQIPQLSVTKAPLDGVLAVDGQVNLFVGNPPSRWRIFSPPLSCQDRVGELPRAAGGELSPAHRFSARAQVSPPHEDTTSGVAQWLACWVHNPKVRGSKPRSARTRGERAKLAAEGQMDGQRIPGRSKSPRARTPTPKRLLA